MEKETIQAVAGRRIHSRLWAVAFCGVAGFVLPAPMAAKDQATALIPLRVDFHATVSAVREVPAGSPMPGLHLDTEVKGQMIDVYIAPMDFVAKYELKISRGDEVHIVGSQTKSEEADVVLAREITIGLYNRGTFYLRDDNGPLWVETKPAVQPSRATKE